MEKRRIPNRFNLILISVLLIFSCQQKEGKFREPDFRALMDNIARGWSIQDTDLALSSFHPDAIYMEPPDIQYYRGHDQLRPYFDALTEGHHMVLHHVWFDEVSQMGAAEFTFSGGGESATTGVAVVKIENGLITFWREYQRRGPADFTKFLEIEGKNWEWHIGNYP